MAKNKLTSKTITKTTKKHKSNKRKKPTKKLSNIKLINLVLALMVLTLTITIFAYYVILTKNENSITEKNENIQKNKQEITKYRENALNKYFEKYSREDKYEVYTQELKKEYIPTKEELAVEKPTKIQELESNKPKLSIIIDDITTQGQIDRIKEIGYDITLSFLPPTSRHLHSADIAQKVEQHMIHFPMEASNFKFEEEDTLHISDSYERIEKKVKELREFYPNATYTNNHTGSKFTSNEESMDKLFRALIKYKFIFVDSRTTGKSVAKQMAKKYNMPYIVRNVFLDNEKDFDYIQGQLKQAISRAKKSGYAIAIGHPYPITSKVLKESKHLLKDLDLVLINKIPTK